jgi:hypothetical protein
VGLVRVLIELGNFDCAQHKLSRRAVWRSRAGCVLKLRREVKHPRARRIRLRPTEKAWLVQAPANMRKGNFAHDFGSDESALDFVLRRALEVRVAHFVPKLAQVPHEQVQALDTCGIMNSVRCEYSENLFHYLFSPQYLISASFLAATACSFDSKHPICLFFLKTLIEQFQYLLFL